MKRRRTGAVYSRISRNPSKDEGGVERQESMAIERAEREEIDVVEVFRDNDRSAFSGKPRPDYDRMVKILDQVDVLIVYAVDRLARTDRENVDLVDLLEETGVEVVTITNGDFDINDPDDRQRWRFASMIAAGESEQKAKRIRDKHADLRRDGKSAGGGRPYGFQPGGAALHVPTPDNPHDEVAIVREMAQRVIGGESLISLVRDLDRRGIPSARGGRWTTQSLRGLLLNPRIAGIRTHTEPARKGKRIIRDGKRGVRQEIREATWPPIIPADQFRVVEAILSGNGRTRAARSTRLLTGHLICGKCGAKMIASKRAPMHGSHRIYICNRRSGTQRGCFANSILAEPLEEMIEAAFVEFARGHLAPEASTDAEEAGREIDRINADRERLGRRFSELDETFLRAAAAALDERMAVAQARLRSTNTDRALSSLLADADGDLDLAWRKLDGNTAAKRALLARHLGDVVIGAHTPGRGFDPSRVLSIDLHGEACQGGAEVA